MILVLLAVFGLSFSQTASATVIAEPSPSVSVSPNPSPSPSPTGKPKYIRVAASLSASHDYLQKHPAPDYWAIAPFYEGQGASSSSVASVAMLLNAARASTDRDDEELIHQDDLLKKTADADWTKSAASPGGSLMLDQLANVVEKAFEAYGFKNVEALPYHAQNSVSFKKTLHDALVENEKSSADFILADFNESSFVGEVEIDHVAVIGAYDAEKKRALIFDTDRQWYEPYWVSEEQLVNGMATANPQTGMVRGFIWIKLRK
jgi:hypothetical protein